PAMRWGLFNFESDEERRSAAIVAGIVVGAFLLRLAGLGAVQFGIDEGYASVFSTQIAWGRGFPLRGIETSYGFHNPPLLFWLLTPWFFLSRDPLVAQGFIAALGSFSCVFAWRAGRLLNGPACGLAAAVIVAICPNAVEHTRRLWGHDFIIFFS